MMTIIGERSKSKAEVILLEMIYRNQKDFPNLSLASWGERFS